MEHKESARFESAEPWHSRQLLDKLALVAVISLLLSVSVKGAVCAQTVTTTTGAISGTISGPSGPVKGATVVVDGPQNASTVTKADGKFRISNLSSGLYRVSVQGQGYKTTAVSDVSVTDGETLINVTLGGTARSTTLKQIARVSVSSSGVFNGTPASIQSITTRTLEERDLPTVRQELESVPGVSVSRSVSFQGNQSTVVDNAEFVVVRGGFPYETGTLIDGHPMYGAVSNEGFSIGFLDTDLLQRVDVVKGPGASTPTINNAIGGTVNFVTINPRESRPGGLAELESDGFAGSIFKAKYVGRLGSKLSYAVGYQQTQSPGPNYGTQGYFVLDPFTSDTVNGQPFVPCGPQGCYSKSNPNPVYNPNNAGPVYFTGVLCCTQDYSAYSDRGEALKLRYDFSPQFNISAGYFGDQTKNQLGLQGLQSYIFTPPAGYAGTLPAGPLNSASAYAGGLDYLFGKGHTSAFTVDAVGDVGRVVLSAKAIQFNQFQNYANDIPFSGMNSVKTIPVTARLYGGVATGDPMSPTSTVYNGTPVSFTTTDPAFTYSYGTKLGGLTLQADLPSGDNVYTVAVDKTQYTPQFEFGEGIAGSPDFLAPNAYAGNYQVIESGLARAAVDVAPKVRGIASMYFNSYNAHVSINGNKTYADHRSYYDAPRLGLTWRPQNDLSVRFAAGASIAPAVLTYLVGSSSAPFANNPTAPTYYAQFITNPNVRPETAFGYDGGFDYRLPRTRTVASFDVYTTNLINQFFTSTSVTGTYKGLPLYTSQYQNIGHARYEGVELALTHDVPRGLFWSASGTLMRAAPYNLPRGFYDQPGMPLSTNLGIINGHNYTGVFGDALNVSVPYSLGSAELGWRTQTNAFLRFDANYYGNNNQYYQPAFVELDTSAGLPVGPRSQVTFSATNLTNAYPYLNSYTQTGFNGGVSPVLANGQLNLTTVDGPGPRTFRVGLTQRF